MKEQATKIAGKSIDVDVLLMFDDVDKMKEFARAVRKYKVIRRRHKTAAILVIRDHTLPRRTPRSIDDIVGSWWHHASPAGQKREKNTKSKRKLNRNTNWRAKWQKARPDISLDEYVVGMGLTVLMKAADVVKDIQPYLDDIEDADTRRAFLNRCTLLRQELDKVLKVRDKVQVVGSVVELIAHEQTRQ